jgi:transposase-like protein
MKKGYKISQEVKDQIIKRVKEDGITVIQAAQEHGVHESTIYGWLGKGA